MRSNPAARTASFHTHRSRLAAMFLRATPFALFFAICLVGRLADQFVALIPKKLAETVGDLYEFSVGVHYRDELGLYFAQRGGLRLQFLAD